MKLNFSVPHLPLNLSVASHNVLRSVMPHLGRKEWMMKQMTRLVQAREAHLGIHRTEEGSDEAHVAPSSIQTYVDQVGHHQIYTANVNSELLRREPSLTRLSENIARLEVLNSRVEFMMNELSSLTRRFRS